MANYHLAILKRAYLDAIIAGEKTVELRLTRTRRAPFGRISRGDTVFLKPTGGPVCAKARVSAVKQFENLTPAVIEALKNRYNELVKAEESFWQSKRDCRFATLIFLEKVRLIEPVSINKRDWRAWVVLDGRVNFGLSVAVGRANRRCR